MHKLNTTIGHNKLDDGDIYNTNIYDMYATESDMVWYCILQLSSDFKIGYK